MRHYSVRAQRGKGHFADGSFYYLTCEKVLENIFSICIHVILKTNNVPLSSHSNTVRMRSIFLKIRAAKNQILINHRRRCIGSFVRHTLHFNILLFNFVKVLLFLNISSDEEYIEALQTSTN